MVYILREYENGTYTNIAGYTSKTEAMEKASELNERYHEIGDTFFEVDNIEIDQEVCL